MNDVIEFFYLKKFAVKVRVQLQLCMMHVKISQRILYVH